MQNATGMMRKRFAIGIVLLLFVSGGLSVLTTFSHRSASAATTTQSSSPSVNSFTPDPKKLTTVTYEADAAFLARGTTLATSGSGYSGSGYVDGYTAVGAETIFTINSPAACTCQVALRYANGSSKLETLSVFVNGVKQTRVSLPATNSWNDWTSKTAYLNLRAGINTLAYTYAQGDSGNVYLNSISIPNNDGLAARGATLPYVEDEAENAATNGTVIGPDRTYLTMASESSGREAVKLSAQGQYVEFTLTQPANAIDLRYSIPDSSDGAGLNAPLSLLVNGHHRLDLSLTSKYSWIYGSFPYTNTPSDGNPHHFFDETHALLGATFPAGTKIRLQVDANDTAPWYLLDLADFYQVAAPYAMPGGYLSITNFGADPTGVKDSTQAVQNAVNAAESQGKGVWIPAGTFTVPGHIQLNNVTIRGAGPWYSVLQGYLVGLYGNNSTNVGIYDLAIMGQTIVRNDSSVDSGVGGSLGDGSVIQNIWIEHDKTGMWFDGPFKELLIVGDTIHDTFADGINLHIGITDTHVEQTVVRNTGDDGMAMWSQPTADQNDTFSFNTVQLPMLANDYGIYGGSDNKVTDDLGFDTVTQAGGVNVGNLYGSVPLAGTTTVARDTLVRTGSLDQFSKTGIGAIWLRAGDSAMTGTLIIKDVDLDDSSYEGIQFIGLSITNVTLDHVAINTAGTYAVQFNAPGAATFSYVTATNLGGAGQYNCDSGFVVTLGPGNTGWSSSYCAPTPTPKPTPTPLPAPTGTLVTAIDAGGTGAGNFVADTDYDAGNEAADPSTAIDTSGVVNPAPQGVWQNCRWNSAFTYTIPGLKAGTSYLVQLDWAELTWQSVGQREFNVAINGNQVLTSFDVYANAGYKRALVRQFSATANSNGQIVISFTQGGADNPFVSGIEVYTANA